MQNCYAVVRVDNPSKHVLVAIHVTRSSAEAHLADIITTRLINRPARFSVVEVALTPVVAVSEATAVERLENEVRTLRTLLTSLQGRVAELSTLSTPQSAHTSWRDG